MKELSEDELLAVILSWENLPLAVRNIADHPEHLDALIKLTYDDSEDKSWRAAWMVDKIHEKHPQLIIPYLPELIDFVFTTHNAGKKRHLLKLISQHELPQDRIGDLLNFCIDTFTSANETIAVRAHAMKVLYNIALKEPDFASELIELIQQEMEYHGSAGIKARGRNLTQKLMQLIQPPVIKGVKIRKS